MTTAIWRRAIRPARSCAARLQSSRSKFLTHMSQTTSFSTKEPSKSAQTIKIPIDGNTHEFSPLLLRDLCECPRCVHESSKQRLFSAAEIPDTITSRAQSRSGANGEVLSISWENDVPGYDSDHRTELGMRTLREMIESGAHSGPFQDRLYRQELWDSKSCDLPDFDFDAYMHDDTALYQALCQLRTHGLAFVQNVPAVEKSVSAIAERIGPVKDTFYGRTWDVRTVQAAINAAYTSHDLDFHTDLLYTHNPPHVQLLHCIQSSSVGGASVFTDAYKAAVDLHSTNPEAFDTLATTPVNYHYNHPKSNLYHATKPVIELRPLRIGKTTYNTLTEFLEAWKRNQSLINEYRSGDALVPDLNVIDCLEKVNWGPPFLAPFTLQEESLEQAALSRHSCRESLNQKVDAWHSAAQKLKALLHRREAMHERLMQPGECVLFDNTRVLHGRKAFDVQDAGKSRWLRGTYVDKDPYLSKLRVLRQHCESQGS